MMAKRLAPPAPRVLGDIPRIVRRAAMLDAKPTSPDEYEVAGGTGTHKVIADPMRRRWFCDCEASGFGRQCSHVAAARAARYPLGEVALQLDRVREYLATRRQGAA